MKEMRLTCIVGGGTEWLYPVFEGKVFWNLGYYDSRDNPERKRIQRIVRRFNKRIVSLPVVG